MKSVLKSRFSKDGPVVERVNAKPENMDMDEFRERARLVRNMGHDVGFAFTGSTDVLRVKPGKQPRVQTEGQKHASKSAGRFRGIGDIERAEELLKKDVYEEMFGTEEARKAFEKAKVDEETVKKKEHEMISEFTKSEYTKDRVTGIWTIDEPKKKKDKPVLLYDDYVLEIEISRHRLKQLKVATKNADPKELVKEPTILLSDYEAGELKKTTAYRMITRLLFSPVYKSLTDGSAAFCISTNFLIQELNSYNIVLSTMGKMGSTQIVFTIQNKIVLYIVGLRLHTDAHGFVDRETPIGTERTSMYKRVKNEDGAASYYEDLGMMDIDYYFFGLCRPSITSTTAVQRAPDL